MANLFKDEYSVDELLKIYKQAEEEILGKLNNPQIDYFQLRQKKAILVQIQNTLAGLEKPSISFFEKAINKEFDDGYNLVENAIKGFLKVEKSVQKQAGNSGAKASFNPVVDSRAVKAVVDEMLGSTLSEIKTALTVSYQNLEKSLNFLTQDTRAKFLRDTGSAIITGEARKELSSKLKQQLEEKGITGFTYTTEPTKINPQGQVRNLTLETYVEGLGRSTLRQARLSGTVQRATESGVDLLGFSTHPKPSEICAKYEGKIVSISGKDKNYPSLEEAMTWYNGKIGMMNHRYCRHTAIPFIGTGIVFDKL
jgi:Phage minor capsid protein 2